MDNKSMKIFLAILFTIFTAILVIEYVEIEDPYDITMPISVPPNEIVK